MPTSQRKIESNRRNAQKSTGPATPKGKSRASKNATTHGLYSADIVILSPHFSENAEEYQQLVTSLYEELTPSGHLQEHLVMKIANSIWRSQRALKAETAHIKARLGQIPEDIRHAEFMKRLRSTDGDPKNPTLTDEERKLAFETSLGKKSIPDDDTSRYILRCEMRLDRQLSRAYRLLMQLQQKSTADQARSTRRKTRNSQLPPGVSYVD